MAHSLSDIPVTVDHQKRPVDLRPGDTLTETNFVVLGPPTKEVIRFDHGKRTIKRMWDGAHHKLVAIDSKVVRMVIWKKDQKGDIRTYVYEL